MGMARRTTAPLVVLLLLVLFTPTSITAEEKPAPALLPAGLRAGRFVLLDRRMHGDYEKATASFEHGVRDDPGSRITHNDWDLILEGNLFRVRTVTDDRSLIRDLGARTFDDVTELPVLTVANAGVGVAAVEGHLYVVHTKDGGSDFVSLFRVHLLVPGNRCVIDWMAWLPPPRRAPFGPKLPAGRMAKLTRELESLRLRIETAERMRVGELTEPVRIVLQLRAGAGGGNPKRVDAAGRTSAYVDRVSEKPLSLSCAIQLVEPSVAFVMGGYLPLDRALVIESVDVYATADGDANGHGEAIVRVGSQAVLSERDVAGPIREWFVGRAVIRPGEEHRVTAEVANSSRIDARFHGRLVTLAEAVNVEPVAFGPGAVPDGFIRAGPAGVAAREVLLDRPRAVLQLRAGAGKGTRRIDLLGHASVLVDRLLRVPLAFDLPLEPEHACLAFVRGGRIPARKAFVITHVAYEGTAKGDGTNPGAFVVKVAGTTIVSRKNDPGPFSGHWHGEVVVLPGLESEIWLEVGSSSGGTVRLEGSLEDR